MRGVEVSRCEVRGARCRGARCRNKYSTLGGKEIRNS